MPNSTLEEGFAAQAKQLREFGYPDISAERVKEAHSEWRAGRGPEGIIDRFCFDAFRRYPHIFGEAPE